MRAGAGVMGPLPRPLYFQGAVRRGVSCARDAGGGASGTMARYGQIPGRCAGMGRATVAAVGGTIGLASGADTGAGTNAGNGG